MQYVIRCRCCGEQLLLAEKPSGQTVKCSRCGATTTANFGYVTHQDDTADVPVVLPSSDPITMQSVNPPALVTLDAARISDLLERTVSILEELRMLVQHAEPSANLPSIPKESAHQSVVPSIPNNASLPCSETYKLSPEVEPNKLSSVPTGISSNAPSPPAKTVTNHAPPSRAIDLPPNSLVNSPVPSDTKSPDNALASPKKVSFSTEDRTAIVTTIVASLIFVLIVLGIMTRPASDEGQNGVPSRVAPPPTIDSAEQRHRQEVEDKLQKIQNELSNENSRRDYERFRNRLRGH